MTVLGKGDFVISNKGSFICNIPDMIAYIMACYTSCGALAGMIPVTKLGTIIKNTVNHKEKRQIGFMFFAPKSLIYL